MRAPRRPLIGLALVWLASACAQEQAAPAVLACGTSRELTGNGIGDFRVGMPVDSLLARCRVTADSTHPLGIEGMPERRVTVRLDSSDVSAIVVDAAVQRIDVETAAFRTSDGLGVGSRLADLRPLAVEVVSGEGNVAAISPRACGLSFLLDVRPVPVNPTARSLADSVRVRKVLILGCDSATVRP